MAETRTPKGRRAALAAILALSTLWVAAPVFAEDGHGEDGSDRTDHSLEWATRLSEDGVQRPEVIADPTDADVETDSGVSPSGVEWSRITFADPSGVEWTRTDSLTPDGVQRTQTVALVPDGTTLSLTVGTRPDGTSFTSSTFVSPQGGVWARRSRSKDLSGVEWTRRN